MVEENNNNLKLNNKPTFKERIFGIPSSNGISKLKYKINVINIFVVIGIMLIASSYFIEDSFRNRSVTISTKYEELIKIPEIKIEAQSIYYEINPMYLTWVQIFGEDNKDLFFSKLENVSDSTYVNYANLTNDFVNVTMNSATLYPNDYFSLGSNQGLKLIMGFFRLKIVPNYYSFNISITVNNDKTFLISSKESFNMGLSKTIKIDKYKNQVEIYKTRLSTTLYGVDIGDGYFGEALENQISFFTQIVTTETTQTDFDIYLQILSSVGSLISTVVLVVGIGFSIITKFLIKDKGGWIDNEIREAILYHSNDLNDSNFLKNQNLHAESTNIINNNNENSICSDTEKENLLLKK